MHPSFIQVGSNVREGVVKLRAPDEKSADSIEPGPEEA